MTCKGSYILGTACEECERCDWERSEIGIPDGWHGRWDQSRPGVAQPSDPDGPLIERCLALFYGEGQYGWSLVKNTWPEAAVALQRRKMAAIVQFLRQGEVAMLDDVPGTGKPRVSYETTTTGAKVVVHAFGCVWEVSTDSGVITSCVFLPHKDKQ